MKEARIHKYLLLNQSFKDNYKLHKIYLKRTRRSGWTLPSKHIWTLLKTIHSCAEFKMSEPLIVDGIEVNGQYLGT